MRVPSVVFGKMSLFVENVIARFFFNLTHVVTRSVSLILLKSGCRTSAQTFDRFSENVSCICRKRKRGHGDMSLSARHLPKWRIFYPKTHGFPDCAPFVAAHPSFIIVLSDFSGYYPSDTARSRILIICPSRRISETCAFPATADLRNVGGFPRF